MGYISKNYPNTSAHDDELGWTPQEQRELDEIQREKYGTKKMTTDISKIKADLPPEFESRAKAILDKVSQVPVATQQQREKAAAILVQIKREIKEVEAQRDEVAKPAYEAYKKMRLKAKPILDPLERAEILLKERIASGAEEEERVTSEALAAAMAAGASQGEIVAIVAAAPDKLEGVSIRKSQAYRILDEALVPREFLMVNHSKLQVHMRDNPDAPAPAGIEYYLKSHVSASTR